MKEYINDGEKIVIDGNKVILPNGKVREDKIGVNYTGFVTFSRLLSSFNKPFTNETIAIGSGIEIIETKIGDISDAYTLLDKKRSEKNPKNFAELCEIVLETVDEYFKGFSKFNERLSYYKDNDFEESKDNKISNLKGKSAAMCTERAALSQNLLCYLEINSTYKCSLINVNQKSEVHSYNLVEYDNKYYIFDTSIPNVINDRPNPLIAEIEKEDYELITCPLHKIGCSIHVSHYNPYQNKEYDVTYDDKRPKRIDVPSISNEINHII